MRTEGAEVTGQELELRLVGALLVRGDLLYDLPAAFGPDVLRNVAMRDAYAGIERLGRAKKLGRGPVDLELLVAEGGLTDGVRALLHTAELSADSLVTRGSTVRDYAQALLDRHRRVKTKQLLVDAVEALEKGAAVDDVAAGVTANLLDTGRGEQPEVISYRDAALETLDVIERTKKGEARPLRTGFERIDRILRIRPGNFVIIAARSKVGKTTIARQIADNVAMRRQHVLMHSLEMSVPEVVTLDLSREASVNSTEFFDERPWPSDTWARVQKAADRRAPGGSAGYLHANHYYPALGAILRISEKLHRRLLAEDEGGLVLVVVDYLNLVQLELGKTATREQVVATISRSLQAFAIRTGVPVLALAQINREGAKLGERPWRPPRRKAKSKARTDQMAVPGVMTVTPPPEEPETPPEDEPQPPPQIHHLRESGALEQDANAVCILHHPFDHAMNEEKRERGPFSFIVAAQRLGPKGMVRLYAEREFSRFSETD